MAARARDAAGIHHALNEVVALHPVLVSGAVAIMRERRLPGLVLFELPEVLQLEADSVADGPVVVAALDGVDQRTSLRMALHAHVDRTDRVEPARVDDRRAR